MLLCGKKNRNDVGVTTRVGLSAKSFASNAATKGYRCYPSRNPQPTTHNR